MKIAFISAFPVFPPHGGNRARVLTLMLSLQKMGHEISFVLLGSRRLGDYDEGIHQKFFGENNYFFLRRNPLWNFIYYLMRAGKIASRFLKMLLGLKHAQFRSVDEVYYRPFTGQIKSIHDRLNIDIVFVEYVLISKAFDAFGADVYKVLDTHDSAGLFLSSKDETKGFRRADVVLAIQDAEADLFREKLGSDADRVKVVSHILDLHESQVDVTNTEGATFLGSSFEANIVSLNYFIRDVLPLIVTKLPSFKLFVAGSVCRDIADQPSVVKLGKTDTLAAAFKAAPISINPIRAGTGVKIKLLESMSLGIPIVSTEYGVHGIDKTFLNGVVCVSNADPQAFADAVILLATDSSLRHKLGICNYHSAAQWNEKHLDVLRGLLKEAQDVIDHGLRHDTPA